MELHDRRTYYRAFQSHDARFDGRVFVGVTSTGIYCRPICPARTPEVRELPLLRLGRRRAGGGLPPLPALPARDRARPRLLARHRQHGEPRAGADRRRRARRRGDRRRDARRAAGRRRPPAAPPVPAPSRRLADRRRPDAARAVRQAAPARHAPADGGSGAGLGLRQRAPLQRDLPRPVRPPAQRAAPQRRHRQFGRARA